MATWHEVKFRQEWVPLGTFWSLDWDSPDDTLEATVTARDRMELLRKGTYQTSQVQQNKSLYELAEDVLQDAGLNSSEYIIDTALQSIVVPYAWFSPISHREALRRIAEAGLAVAFQNRDGKIQIESYLITGDEPVLEITEDDYFPPLRAPSRQDQVANEIIVDTQPLRPTEEGTTNLITNPDCENDIPELNGVSSSDRLTATLDGSIKWRGKKSLKLTTGVSGYIDRYYQLGGASLNGLTPGTTYTFSFYVYVPSNSGINLNSVYPRLLYHTSVGYAEVPVIRPTAYDTWQRIYGTVTPPSDADQIFFRVQITQDISGASIYVDDLQLEQKPYATSFINGTREEEVYRSNEPITIPGNTTKTITAFYNQPPVIDAVASLDSPPAGVSITEATYYGWGASVKIQNTNAADKQVTLVIQGKPLTVQNKERAIARDEASILVNGVLRYEFPANPLVQTLDQAQAIADTLLASVKEPRRDIEVEWRGNPALLLGDRVTVKNQDYYVIRQEIDWAGALSARLTGRKVGS